jgi:uncharacterized membrane protein
VPLITCVILVLVGTALFFWKIGFKSVSILCAAIPIGIVSYVCIGISIPRILQSGRFYSVPFGGFRIGGQDWALIASGSFWIVLWFVVLHLMSRVTKKYSGGKEKSNRPGRNKGNQIGVS